MFDDEAACPFPEPWDLGPDPTGQEMSREERRRYRRVGPVGGLLSDPVEIAKRRAAQKAQRIARRRNRHG